MVGTLSSSRTTRSFPFAPRTTSLFNAFAVRTIEINSFTRIEAGPVLPSRVMIDAVRLCSTDFLPVMLLMNDFTLALYSANVTTALFTLTVFTASVFFTALVFFILPPLPAYCSAKPRI